MTRSQHQEPIRLYHKKGTKHAEPLSHHYTFALFIVQYHVFLSIIVDLILVMHFAVIAIMFGLGEQGYTLQDSHSSS